jgi:predicted nucleic acid-binding protein
MTADEIIRRIKRVGLDSSPIIYHVEKNPDFASHCLPFFLAIDQGTIRGYTSTISLSETLVLPMRNGDAVRENAFRNLLLSARGMTTTPLLTEIAEQSARLRATYSLRTPDAVQIATALHSNCDIFLTNDDKLKRVQEIEVVIVSELT